MHDLQVKKKFPSFDKKKMKNFNETVSSDGNKNTI